jgi:hypothetical protein
MPFEPLPTVPTGKQLVVCGSISYKRNSRSRNNKKSPPRLIICLPTIVNNGAIQKNDRVNLLIGTGSDEGRARLTKAKSEGALAYMMRGGAILLRFGYVPMLGLDAAEREQLEFRANGEGFEFDLPAWFKGKV